ncbi:hypothetical protein TNCV_1683541 [Trichonephila clavipes]|nr:hypothetical protein TNCV_1683541 [Trichonephila clavipes]
MVLKANDRPTSCPCHNEFRGPRSDYVRQGLGSYPGEGMDVCKCTVPLRHGGTLNSRRSTSPLVRLMEIEERWVASLWQSLGCSLTKLVGNEGKSYRHLNGAQSYG